MILAIFISVLAATAARAERVGIARELTHPRSEWEGVCSGKR